MFPDTAHFTHWYIFSGMEIASYLIDKASSITVIGSSEVPYQSTLGLEIGRATMMVGERERWGGGGKGGAACVTWGLPLLILQMLSEKNVRFFMSDSVTEVRGVDGKVTDPNMLSHNKNTVLPV